MNRSTLSVTAGWILACVALPLLGGGCANYEFNLVRPEKFAAHVGKKADVVTALDPLEYHFRTVDGFLVVRIKNPTDDPIQLLGNQSSAIDPRGEAHSLRSQTIPPGTFVKVIVPPPRPQLYDEGPHFGIGFGVIGSARHGWGRDPFFDEYWDEPRVYTLYDEGNNYFWTWPGNSSARLVFAYERNGKTFRDEFTFYKKKM